MTVILECNNLEIGFEKPLCAPINISLTKGETLAVVGQSGVGKTTLLSVLLGLIKPLSGQEIICGENIHAMSQKKASRFRLQNVGTVFQQGELLSEYTAVDNVMFPRIILNKKDKDAEKVARDILNTLGVEPMRLAKDLSGGERQRTALARALINRPQIILADEPTGALDPQMRDEVSEMLYTTIKQTECTLVVVTHDPYVARKADNILELKRI